MANRIKITIFKNRGLIVVALLTLSLLIPSVFTPPSMEAVKGNNTLRDVTRAASRIPVLLATITPEPTISLPIVIPTSAATIASSPTPTSVPVLTLTPIPTPTPTPIQSEPTVTPTLTPTVAPTQTPTPTPHSLRIQIGIDYAGQKPADTYITSVISGQSAWDAVASAVGLDNLQYTDYGGDMGIFITGFNGINADLNQYFEFRIDSASSNIGVSSYKCSDGDKLDFVLTTF